MSTEDRIADLIAERQALAERYPDLADQYAGPDVRRSIASSVAIARAAPPGAAGSTYGALISTSNNWRDGDTPEATAAFIREHFPWQAALLAGLADEVADHIEATAADLLDDGATAAAWRTYARALRGEQP